MSSVRGKQLLRDSFKHVLAEVIRHDAEVARRNGKTPQAYGLESLADYIANRDVRDHRLFALEAAAPELGQAREQGAFKFAREQVRFLSRIGDGGEDVPKPDDLLNELVTATVEDVARETGQARSQDRERVERAEKELLRFAGLEEQWKTAEAKLEEERNKRLDTEALARELEENCNYWRVKAEGETTTTTGYSRGQKNRRRRRRVEGEPNLYQRETSDGTTVYEVGWGEGSGEDRKQRWKTVGSDLEEAKRLRDELTGGGPGSEEPEGSDPQPSRKFGSLTLRR